MPWGPTLIKICRLRNWWRNSNRRRRLSVAFPLFQVMFVLQNCSEQAVSVSGSDAYGIAVDSETAKFDLYAVDSEDDGTD